MRIIVSTTTYGNTRSHLMDMLTGISTVSVDFANYVIQNCDLVFLEGFVPGFMSGGFWQDFPDAIAICPRTDEAHNYLARQWHEIIGALLPHRLEQTDYQAYIGAMQDAGYDKEAIMENITGANVISDLMAELTQTVPLVEKPKIQREEYKVFCEYKRSLYSYTTDCYPTFDLWSPDQLQTYIEECDRLRFYCPYLVKRGQLKLYNVGRLTQVPEILGSIGNFEDVTLEEYQELHLEAKGSEAEARRDRERIVEIESQIDYALVSSEEDVCAGRWVPNPEEILQSHRISSFLESGAEYDKDRLKAADIGKPPLWESIWLYFNSPGEKQPLTETDHDLLNDIVYEKIADRAACWLYKIAEIWNIHDTDDDDLDFNQEYVEYCLELAKHFSTTLKNLC